MELAATRDMSMLATIPFDERVSKPRVPPLQFPEELHRVRERCVAMKTGEALHYNRNWTRRELEDREGSSRSAGLTALNRRKHAGHPLSNGSKTARPRGGVGRRLSQSRGYANSQAKGAGASGETRGQGGRSGKTRDKNRGTQHDTILVTRVNNEDRDKP